MRAPRLMNQEARLLQPPAPARFGAAELDGLPEPVRRHLTQAIAPGTPLATAARLRMRGRIKVGRWLPFRAHQVLNPHHGLVWTARAAGVIVGSDSRVGDTPVELRLRLDAAGRIASLVFDRCGDPDKRQLRLAPVRRRIHGLRQLPGADHPLLGSAGLVLRRGSLAGRRIHRYQLTDLEPVAEPAGQPGR
jgi:hypothetical protein